MRIDIRLLQNIMICIPQHGKYRPYHAPAARLRGRSTFSLDIMHFLPFLPSLFSIWPLCSDVSMTVGLIFIRIGPSPGFGRILHFWTKTGGGEHLLSILRNGKKADNEVPGLLCWAWIAYIVSPFLSNIFSADTQSFRIPIKYYSPIRQSGTWNRYKNQVVNVQPGRTYISSN